MRLRRAADVLASETRAMLTQLRCAAIHPQLTQFWASMGAELQIQGGGLSMVEIMATLQARTGLISVSMLLCDDPSCSHRPHPSQPRQPTYRPSHRRLARRRTSRASCRRRSGTCACR